MHTYVNPLKTKASCQYIGALYVFLAQWVPQLSLAYDTLLPNYSHAFLNDFDILKYNPKTVL